MPAMLALDSMKTAEPKAMSQPYVVSRIMEMSLVAQSSGTDRSERAVIVVASSLKQSNVTFSSKPRD
ncbi:hypothetical protein IG631_11171 [Alternaria alternata]|nr:hypothetical protein IG631_11171 [Alternaria alternata]